jgi:phage terminase large subunit-like protein
MSLTKTRSRRPSRPRLDVSRGRAVVDFIESTCCHQIGKWAGLPFKLAPWQRDFVEAIFGNVDASGRRLTRIAYLQIARKQGKSELAAAIAIYMLIADGEAQPQVYLAARDRDQASIIFRVAADMVERSPHLRGYAKVYRGTKRIVCTKGLSAGGFMHAIASDAAGTHGFNASAVIVDELHVVPQELVDVLETSMSAREQPLMMGISTAGHDRESICYRWYEKARQVQSGHIRDRAFVGRLYELPEGTSFEDVAETDRGGHFKREKDLWPLANPSLLSQPGGFIRPDEIRRQVRDALHFPAAQNKVMQLHFNVWTQSAERWFSRHAWDACGGVGHVFEDFKGRAAFGGLDLSSTADFSACVWTLPDEDGGFDVLCRFWLPEAAVVQRRNTMRDQLLEWQRSGYLELTPGDVIDYAYIKKRILEDCELFAVASVGYDPWHATQLAVELAEAGVPMVPVRQGFKTMSAPSKMLETLVASGKLHHGGNPVLRWMADNVVLEMDPYEAIKPSKKASTERIDGIAACVTALSEALAAEAEPTYDFVAFD